MKQQAVYKYYPMTPNGISIVERATGPDEDYMSLEDYEDDDGEAEWSSYGMSAKQFEEEGSDEDLSFAGPFNLDELIAHLTAHDTDLLRAILRLEV